MTTVSLAPLALSVTRRLGIGHGSMGLVLGASQLLFIPCAVPAGALADRVGVGWSLFLASLTIGGHGIENRARENRSKRKQEQTRSKKELYRNICYR